MQNNNGRFFDGLLLGAIIGGAAVFLLGTKKGNKVLKVISEGGLEGLTEMFADFEEGVEEGIKKTTNNIKEEGEKDLKIIEEKITHVSSKPNETQNESGSRRFFRKGKN